METAQQMSIERKEAETILTCSGVLDLNNSEEFKRALAQATANDDYVVVDFSSVIFIDTAVLADLVVGARAMLRRGKRLKVIAAEDTHPLRTLKIVGFSAVMDIEVVPKPQ